MLIGVQKYYHKESKFRLVFDVKFENVHQFLKVSQPLAVVFNHDSESVIKIIKKKKNSINLVR